MQFYCIGGSENQSVSGVTTTCLTQCNTSPSHRVDQVVDCGMWNVDPQATIVWFVNRGKPIPGLSKLGPGGPVSCRVYMPRIVCLERA